MLTVVLLGNCEKEVGQKTIKIPDNNFLTALIEQGVDKNGDGKISSSEAKVINYLEVSYDSISDMTGIEKFVNLDTLLCTNNQIITFDISNNTALVHLFCSNNQFGYIK